MIGGMERLLIPNFIIGGAARSGTTFLCHALDLHPEIHLAKPYSPEPKVFLGARLSADEYFKRYAPLFAGHGGKPVLGEKTTLYCEVPECAARIHAVLPEVRLLFIVREPIARAYSNWAWSTKNGLETLSFEDAIAHEGRRPPPPRRTAAPPFEYMSRGDYATWVRRYYDQFGRDRVGVFLYEHIQRQPDVLLRDIQMFLGVTPTVLDFREIVNASGEREERMDPVLEGRLRERIAGQVREFAELTGLDVSPWGYDRAS